MFTAKNHLMTLVIKLTLTTFLLCGFQTLMGQSTDGRIVQSRTGEEETDTGTGGDGQPMVHQGDDRIVLSRTGEEETDTGTGGGGDGQPTTQQQPTTTPAGTGEEETDTGTGGGGNGQPTTHQQDDRIVLTRTGEEETDTGTGGGGKTVHHQGFEMVDKNGYAWVVSSFLGQAKLSENVTLTSHTRDFYIAQYNDYNELMNYHHLSGSGIEAVTAISPAKDALFIAGQSSGQHQGGIFIAAIHESGEVQWTKHLEQSGRLTLQGMDMNEWGELEVHMTATTQISMEWEETTIRHYTIWYNDVGELLQVEADRDRR